MFVEKRKSGENILYYLVHSYREHGKVKKIRKYLGRNLSHTNLEKFKKIAEQQILEILDQFTTQIFEFSLSDKEITELNKFNDKIKLIHLYSKEWEQFTEDFVFNTNAIEGSTIAKDEVRSILEKKKVTDPEEKETKGVAKAVEYIRKTKDDLSLSMIKKLHKLCFEDSKSYAGKFRDVEVVIRSGSGKIMHTGVPSEELKDYLNDFVEWYQDNKKKFKPLVLAAIIHNQFEYIHPFQDGNGRVGRLLLNFILLKNKYPPINILLKDRQEYYKTLYEYSANHNLKPTLRFLIKQYKKTHVTTKK